MKKKEFVQKLRDAAPADLDNQASETAQELMKLRLRQQTGQLEQTHRLREVRRNLARVETARAAARKKQA